ncbi:MAG: ClpXP protease specificity-enhancing factor SspB [Alphaproteobacteria bacterium]|nr:ClpXP protease specificity-enhancing factor SspB [Alphaproteobacteria bacterium]
MKEIDYNKIVEHGQISMLKEILRSIPLIEPFGNTNYYYISFLTAYPGVVLSNKMRQQFPTNLTIILQYQFENLQVNENDFSVGLSFNGVPETVVIPYKSIIEILDPTTGFSLQFAPEIPKTKISLKKKTEKPEKETKKAKKVENDGIIDFNLAKERLKNKK